MKCRLSLCLSLSLSLSLMRMLFAAHFPRSRPYHPPTHTGERGPLIAIRLVAYVRTARVRDQREHGDESLDLRYVATEAGEMQLHVWAEDTRGPPNRRRAHRTDRACCLRTHTQWPPLRWPVMLGLQRLEGTLWRRLEVVGMAMAARLKRPRRRRPKAIRGRTSGNQGIQCWSRACRWDQRGSLCLVRLLSCW